MSNTGLIKLVQQLLNIILKNGLKVDGIQGDKTNAAISKVLGEVVVEVPVEIPPEIPTEVKEPSSPHFNLKEYYSNAYVNGKKIRKHVKPPKELWPNIQKSMDRLEVLRCEIGDKPIRITSGYRSPEYNNKLYEMQSGVAKNSTHMRGTATDIQVKGMTAKELYVTADKVYKDGGVGLYVKDNFIHVDLEKARRW